MGGWQLGGGSGLGGGARGGLLPGSPSGSENGGRQPSGAGRAGAAEPVLPRPTSCPQRPPPEVWALRHRHSPGRALSGGGAATQRPRFPAPLVRVRAARRQSRVSARPRPWAPRLARASTPSPFRADPTCQQGSEPRGQQRAVGTQVCSGAIGVWKMPPDGGLGLQLR